ncbi:MAG TPA: flagellar motor protein MotB [Peptococcaceae bacterium]|nr:MAG: OmpA/MotB [Clostridia bacterium 41_269]HBT20162.1 flagellar motor protein MotB [Peptococcaceae bacterium]
MRRRRIKKDIPAGEWLLTYSDLVTLVLVFFVLLYSFSQIDINKFRQFILSFQGSGVLDGGRAPLEQIMPESTSSEAFEDKNLLGEGAQSNLKEIYDMTVSYLKEHGLSDQVEVKYSQRGIALDIKERILFDSGKAVLKPEARRLLDLLSGLFEKLPNQISVEGHTDNRPINTAQYPTNWELSVDRAVKVIRYLTEVKGLDPKKFVAVGFGEYQPILPNTSPENQAQNRRVVMVITTQKINE